MQRDEVKKNTKRKSETMEENEKKQQGRGLPKFKKRVSNKLPTVRTMTGAGAASEVKSTCCSYEDPG